MPVANLPFLLAVAFLSLCVDVRSVPHASVFRRVERAGPHTPSALLNSTCQLILNSLSSSSAVYAPGTCEYDEDMGATRGSFIAFGAPAHALYSKEHWARSSIEYAACSVEPGNVQDLSIVVRTLSMASCSAWVFNTSVPF